MAGGALLTAQSGHSTAQWYIVHMKRVTASDARKNWFQLLDEVLEGEVVVVERKGRRVVLRAEDASTPEQKPVPDYGSLLEVPGLERADEWRWEWDGVELRLTEEEP